MTINIKLSSAQISALRALKEGGGEGVIDRTGKLVVAGERLPHDPATWLRLFTFQMIAETGAPLRLRLQDAGRAALKDC